MYRPVQGVFEGTIIAESFDVDPSRRTEISCHFSATAAGPWTIDSMHRDMSRDRRRPRRGHDFTPPLSLSPHQIFGRRDYAWSRPHTFAVRAISCRVRLRR